MAMTQEWMGYFLVEEVERIVQGKESAENLLGCFRFGLTPEGFDYWWEVTSKDKLGSKAQARLEEMLGEYMKTNAGGGVRSSRRNTKP